tara:strand:- start:195 stop:569 length:375 start_codon:yes stop_codon:yes gene_type:complete
MESVKQEKKDLGKMPGDFKQMSSGSWMSKHVSPIFMGTPLKGNKFGKAMADNDGDYEKAKASMAPQMNESALYHTSTGHGKHVSPERSHSDGQGGMYSSHSHDTQSQQKKDRKMTKKQKSEIKS